MKDFFISYTSADRGWAEWIAWHLEAAGYTTVIQAWDFRPGENFAYEMQTAASETRRTVAVLSSGYLTALFTHPEWQAAFAQDPTGSQRKLIPVRIDLCEPPGLLKAIIYIDLVGKSEEEAGVALVEGLKEGRRPPASPPKFPAGGVSATADAPPFPGAGLQPSATSAASQSQNARQVALLYKRHAPNSEYLLGVLESRLSQAGYQIFIDRHMQIGVEWAGELGKQVKSSYAVVPLLSAESIWSEMLEDEIQTAHQAAQEQGGFPRILPVRVKFTEPLPDPLAAILNPLQYALWSAPEDDDRLVAEIMESLEKEPEMPTELEPVGGAVPLDSRFYIRRPVDDEFKAAIARKDSIVLVKGVRQMGKTSLLARGLEQARESGAHVILTDFQTLNANHLASPDALLVALASNIALTLDLSVSPRSEWDPELGASMNMEFFMRRHALGKLDGPIVWGMDEVDRLFACDFASEIFGLLRSWHNRRALEPSGPWSRLTLAIAYATEAHLFITDLNQSPFNVGTRVTLDDFTPEQVKELNKRYGSPLKDELSLDRFYRLVAGQPYLVRKGLDVLVHQKQTIGDLEAEAAADEGPFGDHLRRILVSLTKDSGLAAAMRDALRTGSIPDAESFYRLRSGGIIVGATALTVRPRCELYRMYLERHLQ